MAMKAQPKPREGAGHAKQPGGRGVAGGHFLAEHHKGATHDLGSADRFCGASSTPMRMSGVKGAHRVGKK